MPNWNMHLRAYVIYCSNIACTRTSEFRACDWPDTKALNRLPFPRVPATHRTKIHSLSSLPHFGYLRREVLPSQRGRKMRFSIQGVRAVRTWCCRVCAPAAEPASASWRVIISTHSPSLSSGCSLHIQQILVWTCSTYSKAALMGRCVTLIAQ